MSNYAFVIDIDKNLQNPVHPAQARKLLSEGKAAVYRQYPFTIILKESISEADIKPLEIKIDPGSKTTGIAILSGVDTPRPKGRGFFSLRSDLL